MGQVHRPLRRNVNNRCCLPQTRSNTLSGISVNKISEMSEDNPMGANIIELPNEILLYIFSYLDSIFILNCLKKVCQRFEAIFSDESVWRNRSSLLYPDTKILFLEPETKLGTEDVSWCHMVYEVETNRKFLTDAKDGNCPRMQTLHLDNVHISTVNELKLICDNRLCISVSRDRTIGFWNVASTAGSLVKHIDQAHDGWVWCVDDCNEHTVCTGAWDSKIKLWSLENFGAISTYKCDAAVLSLSCKNSLIAAGLYNGKLILNDSRIQQSSTPLLEHSFERKGGVIQGVTLEGNNIYVARVNGIVNSFDMRANQIMKSTESLCQTIVSYSYRNGTIVIGDTMSTLTILNSDLAVQSKTEVMLNDSNKDTKIISIKQNDHDMFVGTKNLLSSFLKADPILSLESIEGAKYEMTAIDYDFDNVLLHSSDLQGSITLHKRLQYEVPI